MDTSLLESVGSGFETVLKSDVFVYVVLGLALALLAGIVGTVLFSAADPLTKVIVGVGVPLYLAIGFAITAAGADHNY